jgi:transcription antitermination protein NusB
VRKRTQGREIVLQAMYAAQISHRALYGCLEERVTERPLEAEVAAFARELGRKVINFGEAALTSVEPLLANWDLARVGLLEKLILTIAVVEFTRSPEVPTKVVIDEACELARRFCDEPAVGFVNGLLDRAARNLQSRSAEP